MKLILASQSPRRSQILEDAAIAFEKIVVPTDESYPEGLPTAEIPMHIASEKAKAVFQKLSEENAFDEQKIILSADTIVVLDHNIIGKPKDADDAKHILKLLSGKAHSVYTGVCIMSTKKTMQFYSETKVYFNPLSEAQIDYYVTHFKPFDKAGAYAIQEWIGMIGIEKIEGDIYNVIGLPINKVAKALNSFI